jgi:arylsulfatase A-like enzyme
MDRRDFLKKCAGVAGTVLLSGRISQAGDRKRPNFVFILVDDLGWRDVGYHVGYGYEGSKFYKTPNIDKLAMQGMRFTDAYAACPVCSPTRASIMTGKYPARLHLTDWIHGHKQKNPKLNIPEWTHYMRPEEVTIAEALKAAGYATGHVGKWHLGDDPKYWPENQGFDVNAGGWKAGHPWGGYFSPYANPKLPDGPEGEYLTDREAAEAEKFIEKNKDRPFFLYLSHYTVHTPLQAKQDIIDKYKAKVDPDYLQKNPTYAAMIHSLDEAVGRVAKKLQDAGITEDTIIIFMSDNGGLQGPTDNAPLRAGKGTAYEGGIREPMFIKWPGVAQPGSVCSEPVISMDFYPTMLEMAGLLARPEQHRDGLSLVPLLKQTATLRREAIYWHYPHYHRTKPFGAIRRGEWKLIEYFEDMNVELYNLKDDLGEQNDLAPKMPKKAAELRELLHKWRASVNAQMPTPNPDYESQPDKEQTKPKRNSR